MSAYTTKQSRAIKAVKFVTWPFFLILLFALYGRRTWAVLSVREEP